MLKKTLKLIGSGLLVLSLALSMTFVSDTKSEAAENLVVAANPTTVGASAGVSGNVYRLCNVNTGAYFLTASVSEYNRLVNIGIRSDGVLHYANGVGNDVHRLYNTKSGEHFFTVNYNELNSLVRAGWKYEGVAFTTSGYNNVYRLYNRKTGRHVYTATLSERDYLWQNGWVYEGVAWKYNATGNNTSYYTPNTNTNTNNNTNQNQYVPPVNNNTNNNTQVKTTSVREVYSFTDMNNATYTAINRPNLPNDANNSNITEEHWYIYYGTPVNIAQYAFTYNGYAYVLRSARNTTANISGYNTGSDLSYSNKQDGLGLYGYYQDGYMKIARWTSGNTQYILSVGDQGRINPSEFDRITSLVRGNNL